MAYLILVRHGQSEWNALGKWTGQVDIPLTEKGRQEAQKAAGHLRDLALHKAYTSQLSRAKQTLEEIKHTLEYAKLVTESHVALNERDYGDYTGKNKWEVAKQIGEEEFIKLRRSWDYPIPNGESLKDVHARVLPYYERRIEADLKDGRNVIIAAHGNSLRALMKHLEDVADNKVHEIEIGTGELLVYEISGSGKVISKQIRASGGKA